MLYLNRRAHESIMIRDVYDADGNRLEDIEIAVLPTDQSGIRLGIKADKKISVIRKELLLKKMYEQLE